MTNNEKIKICNSISEKIINAIDATMSYLSVSSIGDKNDDRIIKSAERLSKVLTTIEGYKSLLEEGDYD